MTNKVFVYGTLKKGNSIRGLTMFQGADFVADATTKNATFGLYDLGSFPAVGVNGDNKIAGEVWEVDKETFDMLDRIEGYPTFYNRVEVETSAGNAWMYYIPDIEMMDDSQIHQIKGKKGEVLQWT